jgi:hypothetical protein
VSAAFLQELDVTTVRRRSSRWYFVEKESMSSAMLGSILRELCSHNARWGRQT